MKEKFVKQVVEVKHYIADDGKEFESYHACKEYDDTIYYDKYKPIFEFKWTTDDEDEFRITYKSKYHKEFLAFVSKILNERLRGQDTENECDYKVENLEDYFNKEYAPLVDGHVYNLDAIYYYENDNWDKLMVNIDDVTDSHVVTDTIQHDLINNKEFQKILEDFKRNHKHIDSSKVMDAIRTYYNELQFLH